MNDDRLRSLYLRLNEDPARPVSLTVSNNRVRMASIRFLPGGAVRLRLHFAFNRAPEQVFAALCRYTRTRKPSDWETVGAFARAIEPSSDAPPRRVRRQLLRPVGTTYDLRAIYREINAAYFGNRIECGITWGRRGSAARQRQRSIHFGSWNARMRIIRVNSVLDDPRVLVEFVRFIVFHELLHADMSVIRSSCARAVAHSAEFRARESLFPNYTGMCAYGNELLRRLPLDRADAV